MRFIPNRNQSTTRSGGGRLARAWCRWSALTLVALLLALVALFQPGSAAAQDPTPAITPPPHPADPANLPTHDPDDGNPIWYVTEGEAATVTIQWPSDTPASAYTMEWMLGSIAEASFSYQDGPKTNYIPLKMTTANFHDSRQIKIHGMRAHEEGDSSWMATTGTKVVDRQVRHVAGSFLRYHLKVLPKPATGPEVRVANAAAATEGSPLEFTVSLSEAAAEDLELGYKVWRTGHYYEQYEESDFSGDFEGIEDSEGSLTVTAGQTQATISLPTKDDEEFEGDERYVLEVWVKSPLGMVQLKDGTAYGTILENDMTYVELGIAHLGWEYRGPTQYKYKVHKLFHGTFTLHLEHEFITASKEDFHWPDGTEFTETSAIVKISHESKRNLKRKNTWANYLVTIRPVADNLAEGVEWYRLKVRVEGADGRTRDVQIHDADHRFLWVYDYQYINDLVYYFSTGVPSTSEKNAINLGEGKTKSYHQRYWGAFRKHDHQAVQVRQRPTSDGYSPLTITPASYVMDRLGGADGRDGLISVTAPAAFQTQDDYVIIDSCLEEWSGDTKPADLKCRVIRSVVVFLERSGSGNTGMQSEQVEVSPEYGQLQGGQSLSYDVVLNQQPADGETITVTPVSSDPDALSVSDPLEFTGDDWNQPQQVTVQASADADSGKGVVFHLVGTDGPNSGNPDMGAAFEVALGDPDPPPATPEVSVTAGNGVAEGGDAIFTITANPTPSANLDVSVTVSQSGDFGAATGSQTVTIPTTGSATLTVATSNDGLDEADGSVTAAISAGTGYTVSSGNGAATVAVSDDDVPAVSVSAGSDITEGGDATFTVSASPTPHAALSVSVTVSQSGDYGVTAGSQAVTIPTGGSYTLTIATDNDSVDEANGSVTVTVNTGNGYTVSGTAGAATVAVADDDVPEVSVAGGSAVTEGGDATFTVSANPVPHAPLSVSVSVTQTGDFGAATGSQTVTIPTGGSYTLTIATDNDSVDEANGSVTVTVNVGNGYTVSSGNGAATVAVSDDDDPPPPACVLPDDAVTVSEVTGWRDGLDPDRAAVGIKRFNRVLEAFGEDTGTGVSPMTTEQAQKVSDWLKNQRWDRIARTMAARDQCDGGG